MKRSKFEFPANNFFFISRAATEKHVKSVDGNSNSDRIPFEVQDSYFIIPLKIKAFTVFDSVTFANYHDS